MIHGFVVMFLFRGNGERMRFLANAGFDQRDGWLVDVCGINGSVQGLGGYMIRCQPDLRIQTGFLRN